MRFLHYKQPGSLIIVGFWLFIALTSCAKQPDHTAVSNFQQTAIFQQRVQEEIAVYLLPIQTNDPQKIITLPLNERYELAPSGLHLAVYFGENIRVIDLITLEEIVLAKDVILPVSFIANIRHQFLSWSPDGDKLAVLMGGPSWLDTSVASTTVVIFDREQKFPNFVYNNSTFIIEVAWSEDSTLVSFPEIEVPCDYRESCQEGEEVIWRLTTLTHSGDNQWEALSSTQLDPINENSWRQNSVCELNLSPTNDLVTYQSPCMLGYIPFDRNGFIAPIQSSQPILPLLRQRYLDLSSLSLIVQWLGETDRFLLAVREDVFGVDPRTDNTLELYRKDETVITLLNEVDMEGHNFAFPLTLSISPDNQYVIQGLEDDHVLLVQLDDLTMTATFLEIPTISANGLWLPEGYLTQSEDKIVFIYSETGEWEVVQDNLPEGFDLVGWQIPEK